ncbi:hypothetical protein [Actinomadura roseirufa]|uniref:hypothetical protein n=1 Tax=Actinomadura roseirufa TaxID=2094049 RepID=UPI001041304A|nr:hypothetical protein [Actinomadura roseirufa]
MASGHGSLAMLGTQLSARGLKVKLTASSLKVWKLDVPGCCEEVSYASDTITCRRRAEDRGVRWFYTSWQEPIAPTDDITDAAVYVLGYLSRRPEVAGAGVP